MIYITVSDGVATVNAKYNNTQDISYRFGKWNANNLPAIYEKVKRRRTDYIYCSVEFEEGYKSYYYIADEDNISVGDYVIVPVGKDNHHSVAKVVKVEYFAEEDVPLPFDRTKHIIRQCTDEDFDPPEE